jgi:hypothetical protein
VLVFLLSSSAHADSRWTLTTADFASRQVDLLSIDNTGATVAEKTGAPSRVVKWDQLLSLERQSGENETARGTSPTPAATQPGDSDFIVYLTSGDQLRGQPLKLDGETLTWTSPAIGTMSLPLKQVAGFVRDGQPAVRSDENRTEDVVMLANGDSVHGILSAITSGTIKVQSQDRDVPVPLSSVSSVRLASTPGAADRAGAAARGIRVKLMDDSIITAPSVQTRGDQLVLAIKDAATGAGRQVPLASVAAIEQINGPVSWLSSRTPSENIQTPLLETTRPARMDRTVSGKPIRFGDHVYSRGIGVVPYSRLSFPLDPARGYTQFRTQYAIAGNGSYADVTVRIKLDGKVVHERKDLTAGEISPVVTLPLNHAKSITLEVDYGQNLSVQDSFNWIEPALVKEDASAAVRKYRQEQYQRRQEQKRQPTSRAATSQASP